MAETRDLRRTYLLTDTIGGPLSPLEKRDADADICTNFRCFPNDKIYEKYDIYHSLEEVHHLVSLLLDEHTQTLERGYFLQHEREEFKRTITGVFINTAKRTESTNNGEGFYVATALDGSFRAVTTPLEGFASIRDKIETLHQLPNTNNGLYSNLEQFRSSYTPRLLIPDHGLHIVEVDKNSIPARKEVPHVAYIDRFGNIISYTGEGQTKEINTMMQANTHLNISINNVPITAKIAKSLATAESKKLSIYNNGGIDFVVKWSDEQTPQERLDNSAFIQFKQPKIGDHVKIQPAY